MTVEAKRDLLFWYFVFFWGGKNPFPDPSLTADCPRSPWLGLDCVYIPKSMMTHRNGAATMAETYQNLLWTWA